MTAELVRTVNLPTVTWADVLRYLNIQPNSVEAAAVAAVCKRYALDPLLRHVRVLDHEVYITRDGMIRVAHQSGQLDGIVVEEERRNSTDDGWTAYVSVWRKDMSHPFRYGAQCKDKEPQKDRQAMALARAERRALRRAFDIVAKDGDTEDEPILDADLPPGDHRVVDGDRNGVLTCACGEKFDTAWGWKVHHDEETMPAQTPGSAPTAGHAPAGAPRPPAAAPAGPGPAKHRGRRAETGPPADYYDNLPEARNYNETQPASYEDPGRPFT